MDKNTTLESLKQLVHKGEISRRDVEEIFRDSKSESLTSRQINFSQVLYYIGAAIVLVGISVLVWQHWKEFNLLAKLLITLGSGIAAYVAAALFDQHPTAKQLSPAFFLLSAMLLPLGLGVLFNNAG